MERSDIPRFGGTQIQIQMETRNPVNGERLTVNGNPESEIESTVGSLKSEFAFRNPESEIRNPVNGERLTVNGNPKSAIRNPINGERKSEIRNPQSEID